VDFDFSNLQSENIADHGISDMVWGLFVRKPPDKPGFNANLEVVFGFKATLNVYSNDKFKEETTIGEAEFTIGYRLKTLPLNLSVGYGIWEYDKPVRGYPYTPSLIIDKILERLENWGHEAILKAAYSF